MDSHSGGIDFGNPCNIHGKGKRKLNQQSYRHSSS